MLLRLAVRIEKEETRHVKTIEKYGVLMILGEVLRLLSKGLLKLAKVTRALRRRCSIGVVF